MSDLYTVITREVLTDERHLGAKLPDVEIQYEIDMRLIAYRKQHPNKGLDVAHALAVNTLRQLKKMRCQYESVQ